MRQFAIGLCILVMGCTVFPAFITQPTNMSLVPGGIADTRPFFGTYKNATANGAESSLGTFMLASCGCGDWRVLFKPDDGSPQRSFPIKFYTEAAYDPNSVVTIYTDENGELLSAQVDQQTGLVVGRDQTNGMPQEFAGMRGEAHTDEVDACGLCHLGENPIWPLPPQHPKKYLTNPRVCFECHTVNGQ